MATECERCGSKPDRCSYELFDYCAKCSRNLCPDCMEAGCCGSVPAESGMDADDIDSAETAA